MPITPREAKNRQERKVWDSTWEIIDEAAVNAGGNQFSLNLNVPDPEKVKKTYEKKKWTVIVSGNNYTFVPKPGSDKEDD